MFLIMQGIKRTTRKNIIKVISESSLEKHLNTATVRQL